MNTTATFDPSLYVVLPRIATDEMIRAGDGHHWPDGSYEDLRQLSYGQMRWERMWQAAPPLPEQPQGEPPFQFVHWSKDPLVPYADQVKEEPHNHESGWNRDCPDCNPTIDYRAAAQPAERIEHRAETPRELAIFEVCPISRVPVTEYEINTVNRLTRFAEHVLASRAAPIADEARQNEADSMEVAIGDAIYYLNRGEADKALAALEVCKNKILIAAQDAKVKL